MKNDNVKKISVRPFEPVVLPDPVVPEDNRLMIEPFEDGQVFKFTKHPTAPGQFVLFDSKKNVVAVSNSAPYCNLICDAVRMLFAAAALAQQQADQAGLDPAKTGADAENSPTANGLIATAPVYES